MDVKRSTMTKQVYEILKKKIIDGDYEEGQKLTEQGTAKELKVSATPVRMAFKKLSSEGFIETIEYRGVFVKSYSRDDVREAYLLRSKLEGLVVQLCIERMTDEKLKHFEEIVESVMQSNETNPVTKYYPIYNEIYLMSESQVLLRNVMTINAIINVDRLVRIGAKIDPDDHHDANMKLVENILNKDTVKAVKQAEANVLRIMDIVLENFDERRS